MTDHGLAMAQHGTAHYGKCNHDVCTNAALGVCGIHATAMLGVCGIHATAMLGVCGKKHKTKQKAKKNMPQPLVATRNQHSGGTVPCNHVPTLPGNSYGRYTYGLYQS